MATKKALVRYQDTGRVEELRSGDTIEGAASSGSETFSFFAGG